MPYYFLFMRQNMEAFIWISALLMLAFMNPENTQATLCLWHHVGFDSCPGCGLGHSVSAAFHGRLGDSFSYHPFGIFAILVLLARCVTVFQQNKYLFTSKTKNHVKNL